VLILRIRSNNKSLRHEQNGRNVNYTFWEIIRSKIFNAAPVDVRILKFGLFNFLADRRFGAVSNRNISTRALYFIF